MNSNLPNRQQSQSPTSEPETTSEKQTHLSPHAKPNPSNFTAWIIFIVAGLLIGTVGILAYQNYQLKQQMNKMQAVLKTATIDNQKPTSVSTIGKTTDMNTQNSSNDIVFPFIRDDNIYIYKNGNESLLVSAIQKSTGDKCYNLTYPFISPNKKFVAYIEQTGDSPGYFGCREGTLKIIDLSLEETRTTNFKTSYYSWNNQNQIELETETETETETNQSITDGEEINTSQSISEFLIYDPTTQQKVASEVMKYSDRDEGIRGFPIYNSQKKIRYKDSKYYLVDSNNTETYLLDKNLVRDFRGFSPNGEYAMFISNKHVPENSQSFTEIWYAVNTDNITEAKQEVLVSSGAAGGAISTGLKWLFNEAFISYCSQSLSYLNGNQSLELTNDGGGGCHNEEGFISTSPDGNNAIVKFKSHFELRSKDGSTKKILEKNAIPKGRGDPGHMIWIDNDNLIVFQSEYGGGSNYPETPIYIFQKQTNTIRPLISNGYLVESAY